MNLNEECEIHYVEAEQEFLHADHDGIAFGLRCEIEKTELFASILDLPQTRAQQKIPGNSERSVILLPRNASH